MTKLRIAGLITFLAFFFENSASAGIYCFLDAGGENGNRVSKFATQLIDLKAVEFEGKRINLRAFMDERGYLDAEITNSETGFTYLSMSMISLQQDFSPHFYLSGSNSGLVGNGKVAHLTCRKTR